MPDTSKIQVRSPSLSDLLFEIGKRGTIRIPRFQREYVWESTRVIRLLDSIYREFPIGSLFFWITPREYRSLYKQIPELKLPEPAEYDQIKLILDGQQRVTSLFVTAKGLRITQDGGQERDYRKICFDLDAKGQGEQIPFLVRPEDKQRFISLWRLFDSAGEEEVYDSLTLDRRRAFKECQKILCNYPLSVVEVEDKDLSEAVLIFERINQGGKKLNLFDLVVASTWSPTFDLKEEVNGLNAQIDKAGFGRIDEETVTQALALAIKRQCTRAVQLTLTQDEIQSNWERVSTAIKLAIDYARENLGVRIAEFLPYAPMLALLSYLYVKNETKALSPSQAAFVEGWFWRSAFSNRYAGSVLTDMGNDVRDFFDPIVAGDPVKFAPAIDLTQEDLHRLKMSTRSAVKNAILCMLALRHPRHFRNNGIIVLDRKLCSDYNAKEKHHIFPKAFLKKRKLSDKHLLANFTFIPNELNQAIKDKPPSEYLAAFKKENPEFDAAMDSHLIPIGQDAGVWADNYQQFVKQRVSLIFKEIEKRVGRIGALQEKPASVVDQLEVVLRNYLDQCLIAAIPDYWPSIPTDIRQSVQRKLDERIKRHPYDRDKPLSNRTRLDYLDIMDYSKIILANWPIFEAKFGSKAEVEKHFLNIKEFRNALKHGRALNSIERKQGEASVEWLQSIIGLQSSAAFTDVDDSDEGEESQTEFSEVDLMAMAEQRHVRPLVEVCRRMSGFWPEQARTTYGGSFRYWAGVTKHRRRMVFGINVSGELTGSTDGELPIWIRVAKMHTALAIAEDKIRERITEFFPKAWYKTPRRCIVSLRSVEDAERLVKLLSSFALKEKSPMPRQTDLLPDRGGVPPVAD